jgi:hypothetical protein
MPLENENASFVGGLEVVENNEEFEESVDGVVQEVTVEDVYEDSNLFDVGELAIDAMAAETEGSYEEAETETAKILDATTESRDVATKRKEPNEGDGSRKSDNLDNKSEGGQEHGQLSSDASPVDTASAERKIAEMREGGAIPKMYSRNQAHLVGAFNRNRSFHHGGASGGAENSDLQSPERLEQAESRGVEWQLKQVKRQLEEAQRRIEEAELDAQRRIEEAELDRRYYRQACESHEVNLAKYVQREEKMIRVMVKYGAMASMESDTPPLTSPSSSGRGSSSISPSNVAAVAPVHERQRLFQHYLAKRILNKGSCKKRGKR